AGAALHRRPARLAHRRARARQHRKDRVMTTTDTTASSTTGRAATDDRQWWSLARLQVTDALRGLTITALVTLVVLAVMALVSRWQGWDLVVVDEVELGELEVPPIQGSVLWVSLVVLPISVGIAAIVLAVVHTARTRV